MDEVSMVDTEAWEAMTKLLGLASHAKHRGFREADDEYGSVHLILFGFVLSVSRCTPRFYISGPESAH